jgi:hypothetical protein
MEGGVMKTAIWMALRAGAAIPLLALAAFCGFGFLASWEPDVVPGMNAIFRVLYPVIAVTCIAGVGAVLFGRTRKALYVAAGLGGIWTAAVVWWRLTL